MAQNRGAAGGLSLRRCVQNGTSIPLHATLRLTRKMRVLDRHGNYRDEEEHLWAHREGPLPATSGSQMHRMCSRAFVPGSGSEALDTPSITTELVQCKYEVQSVVRPYSGCCGTRVIAALPITVVATPFQEPDFSEPPKPPDWNPQVFDSQVLSVCVVVCFCRMQVQVDSSAQQRKCLWQRGLQRVTCFGCACRLWGSRRLPQQLRRRQRGDSCLAVCTSRCCLLCQKTCRIGSQITRLYRVPRCRPLVCGNSCRI